MGYDEIDTLIEVTV